ncbi:ATP-binding protein [Euzebya tangerina]|uniref:ATP-binding protein n=1 Tax=Euzebya tangerina TaxID=591198 RepID=UPI0013C3498D|nr:ATP-binding protein [Euzebya tangerina]
MTDWTTLRVPASAHVVGIARAMTVASASGSGLAPERVDDVRTCTSEAVTNALQAHRRAEVTLPIVVRTQVDGDSFVVEVGDCGNGLSVTESDLTVTPADPSDIAELAEGGFGIPVMRELSDGFDVRPGGLLDPAIGTTIRMAFELTADEPAETGTSLNV